jgi:hypothetical protein
LTATSLYRIRRIISRYKIPHPDLGSRRILRALHSILPAPVIRDAWPSDNTFFHLSSFVYYLFFPLGSNHQASQMAGLEAGKSKITSVPTRAKALAYPRQLVRPREGERIGQIQYDGEEIW